MMDNNTQAVDIKGYRVLSQVEKDLMNDLKTKEQDLLIVLDLLKTVPGINQRSLAIAKTEIQTGFMWAVRSIARPNGE